MVSEVAKSFKDKKCLEKKIIFNILAGLSKSSEDVQKSIEMIKKLKGYHHPAGVSRLLKLKHVIFTIFVVVMVAAYNAKPSLRMSD